MVLLASSAWVFTTSGWVLAAAGMLLAVWALFWDRPRGRRRCPKCWYDMAGVPGLRCPECGREARRERRLFRTRRRWRWAALAAVLLLIAVALPRIPESREHGWPGAVPTTVLIGSLNLLATPATAEGQGEPSPRIRLYHTLIRRIEEDRLSRWQRRWLIERCIAGIHRHHADQWHKWRYDLFLHTLAQHAEFARLPPESRPAWFTREPIKISDRELQRIREGHSISGIHTRARWPIGVPLRVRIDPRLEGIVPRTFIARADLPHAEDVEAQVEAMGYGGSDWTPWTDGTVVAGIPASASRGVTFDITLRDAPQRGRDPESPDDVVFTGRVRHPVVIAGTVDDFLQPFESDEFTQALQNSLGPLLGRMADGELLVELFSRYLGQSDNEVISLMDLHRDLTLAVRIELCDRGRVIATADAWWKATEFGIDTRRMHIGNTIVALQPVDDAGPEPPYEGLTLRLTGDPAVALRNLNSMRYWRGQVEVPIHWRSDYFHRYKVFRRRE